MPLPDPISLGLPFSSWVPQNEVDVPAPVPVRAPIQSSVPGALHLAMAGQEVVRAEIPVLQPGVSMFPGLLFTFSNVPCKLGLAIYFQVPELLCI